jgi:hypothetical protein
MYSLNDEGRAGIGIRALTRNDDEAERGKEQKKDASDE